MAKINKYEELECWQEARKLVNNVYDLISNSTEFGRDFRLGGQITGSAISVMNNIAEGFDSQTNPEFIRFLTIARRSVSETQSCGYIALDRNYISKEQFNILYLSCDKCRKIIDGLLKYLRTLSKRTKPAKPA